MLPKEWDIVSGEDITKKITKGQSPKWQGFDYQESGTLFVTSENVRDGKLDITSPKFLPIEFNKKLKGSQLKKNDILINIVGASIGRSCLFNLNVDHANINQAVCLFRTNDKADSHYILQFLQLPSTINRLLGTQSESARPNLSLGDMRVFQFLLPPLPEQKKIAKILSIWDQAIATTEQLLKNSQRQKKAMIQQLVGNPEGTRPETNPNDFKRIADIAERIQRKSDGGGHPVLTISSLGGFVRQDEKYSRFMAGKSVENYILLRQGEFAYNKGNSKTYEFGCIFDLESFETGLVPHVYVCFRLKLGLCHRYFKYLFEADYLKPQLGQLVNTGVRNNGLLNIKPSEFMNTKIPVPALDEQERIADMLHTASVQISSLEQKLAYFKQEKKALMQQLLTGKRRVKIDELEAA